MTSNFEKNMMQSQKQTDGSELQGKNYREKAEMTRIVGNQTMLGKLKSKEVQYAEQPPVQMESTFWKILNKLKGLSQAAKRRLISWWHSSPETGNRLNEDQVRELIRGEENRTEEDRTEEDFQDRAVLSFGEADEQDRPFNSDVPGLNADAPILSQVESGENTAVGESSPSNPADTLTAQQRYDLEHWDDAPESSRIGRNEVKKVDSEAAERERLMKNWDNPHQLETSNPEHPAIGHYGKHDGTTLGSFTEYLHLAEQMRQLIETKRLEPSRTSKERLQDPSKHNVLSLDNSYKWEREDSPCLFMIIKMGKIFSFGVDGKE